MMSSSCDGLFPLRRGAKPCRSHWRQTMAMQTESMPLSMLTGHDLQALARNWWLLMLRGIVSVIFGVMAFFWPGITLLALTLLYGAFAFVDGILCLTAAVTG